MYNRSEERYKDLLRKIHENNLQFLNLIDLEESAALEKLDTIPESTYRSLVSSVEYHASKASRVNGLNPSIKLKPKVSAQPVNKESSPYSKLLNPATPSSEIDQKYKPLRAIYLKELSMLESAPGCTKCKLGKLRRKYIDKFKELDA